jgi:hypothetical protein
MSSHIFLSHSATDKPVVEKLARRLVEEGIEAWLDRWNLIPGDPWQPAIEEALQKAESCVVFVGYGGLRSWQTEEMRAAIDRSIAASPKVTNGSALFRFSCLVWSGPTAAACPLFLWSRLGWNTAAQSTTRTPQLTLDEIEKISV